MKKTKELRGKKDAELHTLVKEKYDAVRSFRFGASGAKARNVKESRNLRKDIARAKTILTERARAAAKNA